MNGVAPELVLFIGGGVITLGVAVFLIVLLVRAHREHDREYPQEKSHESTQPDPPTDGTAP